MNPNRDDVCVLVLGEYDQSPFRMRDVFEKAGWGSLNARTRAQAMELLAHNRVHVVIARADLPGWPWKTILSDLNLLADPPLLIVTSRIADDLLWSEVLNSGGYDVLPEPFNPDELERVVASACRNRGRHNSATGYDVLPEHFERDENEHVASRRHCGRRCCGGGKAGSLALIA